MRVFVKNMRGQPLMPCSQRKARVLLKRQQAIIVNYNPFTVQLKYATGESLQHIDIGIDEGTTHIGVAITSNEKVLIKGEISLRNDISKLLLTRAQYRRNRRIRKIRYRKARYMNRKLSEKHLPPSIQSKLRNTFFWIDKFCSLVPQPILILHIEVAKFNIFKMHNNGKDYSHGMCFGFDNIKEYVLDRDKHTCQICGAKQSLHIHHLLYRSKGGTDTPHNLITLCNKCHTHTNHQPGGILWQWMIKCKHIKQYRAPNIMNIIRTRTIQYYPNAIITYGNTTAIKRTSLSLTKTHYNDAIAISGIKHIKENDNEYFVIQQFRKKKRSLHESTPRKGIKQPNRSQKRNNKNIKAVNGWFLNDEVLCQNQKGWITGFSRNYAYVIDCHNKYIKVAGKKYNKIALKYLTLICHNNNWRYSILKI